MPREESKAEALAEQTADAPSTTSYNIYDIYQSDVDTPNSSGRFHALEAMGRLEGKSNVSIFGVIVSVSIPKRTSSRATHPLSVSFSIIDPTVPKPSCSICINWFFHDLSSAANMASIGDILICQNMRIGSYNQHPQVNGNNDKCRIIIFHCKRGLDSLKFDSLPPTLMLSGGTSNQLLVAAHLVGGAPASTTATSLLSRDEWVIYSHGRPAPFHWEQVNPALSWLVLMLSCWAVDTLSKESMADASLRQPLLSLSAITRHAVQAASANRPPVHASSSSATVECGDERVDTVAMVVRQIIPSAGQEGASPTILVLWDGSTPGLSPLEEQFIPAIRSALSSCHSALSSSSSSSSDPASPEACLRLQPTPHLVGGGVLLQNVDASLNHHLERLTPGTWIRIRNAAVRLCLRPPSADQASISGAVPAPLPSNPESDSAVTVLLQMRPDTQLGAVGSYFRDVHDVLGRLHSRMDAEAKALAAAQSLVAAANGSRTQPAEPSMHEKEATDEAVNACRSQNANGHSFTPLTFVLASPAPAQFCCFGKVLDWYPDHASKFVTASKLQACTEATATTVSTHEQDPRPLGGKKLRKERKAKDGKSSRESTKDDDAFLHTNVIQQNIFTQVDEEDDDLYGDQDTETVTSQASNHPTYRREMFSSTQVDDGIAEEAEMVEAGVEGTAIEGTTETQTESGPETRQVKRAGARKNAVSSSQVVESTLQETQTDGEENEEKGGGAEQPAAGEASSRSLKFMFSLRMTDGTAVTEVIFYDEDAEFFVGASAEEFSKNREMQDWLQQQLERMRDQGKELEIYVKTYELVGHKKKRADQSVEVQTKRIRAFMSKLQPQTV